MLLATQTHTVRTVCWPIAGGLIGVGILLTILAASPKGRLRDYPSARRPARLAAAVMVPVGIVLIIVGAVAGG